MVRYLKLDYYYYLRHGRPALAHFCLLLSLVSIWCPFGCSATKRIVYRHRLMIYLDLRQALIHRLVGVVAPVAPEAGVVLPFCVFCEYKMVKKNSIRIEMLGVSEWRWMSVSHFCHFSNSIYFLDPNTKLVTTKRFNRQTMCNNI